MEISSLYLKAFYQLSQDKNFTKAAGNLAITQSAFSHRILNLEKELETTLFIREKGNIQLTDAGEKLLRYCEQVYKLQEEVLESICDDRSNDLVGTIRIGGFSSVNRSCVMPALAKLLRDNSRVSIAIFSVEIDELIDLMKSSKVDFVLSNTLPQNNSVQADFLGYENNVLVESIKYKFNGHYLDHDSKDVTTSSYFKINPKLDKKTRKRYFADVYGLIDGVKLGLGRAVLPTHLIEKDKDLRILFPEKKLKVALYLLYYKNTYQTKLEKAVIKAITEYLKSAFS